MRSRGGSSGRSPGRVSTPLGVLALALAVAGGAIALGFLLTGIDGSDGSAPTSLVAATSSPSAPSSTTTTASSTVPTTQPITTTTTAPNSPPTARDVVPPSIVEQTVTPDAIWEVDLESDECGEMPRQATISLMAIDDRAVADVTVSWTLRAGGSVSLPMTLEEGLYSAVVGPFGHPTVTGEFARVPAVITATDTSGNISQAVVLVKVWDSDECLI